MADVKLHATNVHVNPALIPLLKAVRKQTRTKSLLVGVIIGSLVTTALAIVVGMLV